ncbi:hypothetical protein [Mycoplasma sp. Ms02]|uniref:hypothetical protein n=1 Tax=Mycoplasma sp. Ms02 TaxID=353851 RepID=UPI001C8A6436|nr:hypothetical protein [Mycoplasma sp. Ms02]QZE12579.1 hypothetical protein K4L35_01165 [Mycoplasma sp. Ms02]
MNGKGKKLRVGLGITTSLLGAGAFGALAYLYHLRVNPEDQKIAHDLFDPLNKEAKLLEDLLKENNENLDPEFLKELQNELEHAQQFLDNKKSSLGDMLRKRNVLRKLRAKARVLKASPEELDQQLENYLKQVKDNDLRSSLPDLLNATKAALANADNKQEVLNNFFKSADNLIDRQTDLEFNLELKALRLIDNIAKGTSSYKTPAEKAMISSYALEVLKLLDHESYTHDNLKEASNLLDSAEAQVSKNLQAITDAMADFSNTLRVVESEVYSAALSQDAKDLIKEQLASYKELANSPEATLSSDKLKDLALLKELVQNEIQTISNLQNQEVNLKSELEAQIANLSNLDLPENQKEALISNYKDLNLDQMSKEELVKKLTQIKKAKLLLNSAKALQTEIQKQLASLEQENAIDPEFKQSILDKLNELSSQTDGQKLLTSYTDLLNTLKDSASLNLTLKQFLNEVEKQAEFAYEYGLEVDKDALKEIANKAKSLVDNEKSVETLSNELQKLSNQLRDINKKELDLLHQLAQKALDEQDSLSPRNRVLLRDLNSKALPLIQKDSAAVRQELQFLIEEYKKLLKDSRTDESTQNLREFTADKKEGLKNIFDKDSLFGQKLQQDLDSLLKQGELISLSPSLSEEAKKAEFDKIQQKIQNVLDHAEKFKTLEESLAKAKEALASVVSPVEADALQKEIKRIEDLLNKGEQAINAPDESNPIELASDLDDAVVEFKEKQAKHQADQAAAKIVDKINNVFAGASDQEQAIKENFLNKAQELRDQINNPDLSQDERDALIAQMQTLSDNATKARELNKEANKLQNAITRAQNIDLDELNPTTEIEQAQAKLAQIQDLLKNLNNGTVTPAQTYDDLTSQAQSEQENLDDALTRALLKNSAKKLVKYEGDNVANDPYSQANA